MNIFSILLQQLILLALYMAVGVILIRTGVLSKTTAGVISRYVMKCALPVMLFANTVNGVDRQTLFGAIYIPALTAVFYALLYFLSLCLAKACRVSGSRGNIYRALTMFGNIGFMGIPIITGIYGDTGMLYISLFTLVDQAVLWSIGVKLTSPEDGRHFKFRKMINPPTVAIAAALIFILADIKPPILLNTALTKIGSTATPMSMVYLGAVFACLDVREYMKQAEFHASVVFKMLIFPILLFALLAPIPISADIRLTMTVLAALPSMTTVVMMVDEAGTDGDYALGAVFVTTLASALTLPAVVLIAEHFSI